MAMEALGRSPPIAGLKTTETSLQRMMWLAALRWVLAASGSWQNQMLVLLGGPADFLFRIPLFIVYPMSSHSCHTSLSLFDRLECLLSFCAKIFHSSPLWSFVQSCQVASWRDWGSLWGVHSLPLFLDTRMTFSKQSQEFLSLLWDSQCAFEGSGVGSCPTLTSSHPWPLFLHLMLIELDFLPCTAF